MESKCDLISVTLRQTAGLVPRNLVQVIIVSAELVVVVRVATPPIVSIAPRVVVLYAERLVVPRAAPPSVGRRELAVGGDQVFQDVILPAWHLKNFAQIFASVCRRKDCRTVPLLENLAVVVRILHANDFCVTDKVSTFEALAAIFVVVRVNVRT